MKIVADVHLHSYYSRATSKNLNLENLYKWAQLKGLTLVGTGDIAHPGWLQEMQQKLEPAEEGLFKLKDEIAAPFNEEVFAACQNPVRFMLAGEISNIYKKNDKVRKIHNVVFMPSFEALEKFQARLEKIGNIRSDGRPILGLDSRDLLEIVLETDPQGYLIPAHIWTPWFALLGSMSGFDSVEECFDDLSDHIFALETGLSSDPPMNWRLSILDKYTLVSNSDAHSPQKLAREANLFDTELSYPSIFDALKTGDHNKFKGTIEFFPEEGKYHFDGHRKCEIRWHPKTTLENNCICPVCGNKVTVGVMHRAELLADRGVEEFRQNAHPFRSLVPLPEMLGEIHNVGATSKKVAKSFDFLLSKLGSELYILLDAPLEDIEKVAGPMVSEGIRRMRFNELQIKAGFDGEYGKISMFDEKERHAFSNQLNFFIQQIETEANNNASPAETKKAEKKNSYKKKPTSNKKQTSKPTEKKSLEISLNAEQVAASELLNSSLIISAGPGTGKTRTLAHRILNLLAKKSTKPENILAITFTNKAAEEMRLRLGKLVGEKILKKLTISTFHAFCASILRDNSEKIGDANFIIADEEDQHHLLKKVKPEISQNELRNYIDIFNHSKINLGSFPDSINSGQMAVLLEFENLLKKYNLVTIDELISKTVFLFRNFPEVAEKYQSIYRFISVDEYQDINHAQYSLLKTMCGYETNLCVIGDPDQAIYGFRGSDRDFFLKFEYDFPNAQKVRLEKNYRSSQTILDASSQVIAKDESTEHHKLRSEIPEKTQIEIYAAQSDKAEAEYVVHEIERAVGGTSYFSLDSGRVKDNKITANHTFSDFTVLYRTKAQAQQLKIALTRSGMPFQIIGEKAFHDNIIIREILNYINFVLEPNNDILVEKILHRNHLGVNKQHASEILIHCQSRNIRLWDYLKSSTQFTKAVSKLENLINLQYTLTVEELLTHVKNQHFPGNYFEKDENRQQLFNRLLNQSKPYNKNLMNFLDSICLYSEADEYDPNADRITLMTLHASKGMEFPVVFITGCEENLLPFQNKNRRTDLSEERRLFYVGMTRAQQKLILTRAKKRMLWGQFAMPKPSPYLNDIEDKLKSEKKTEQKKVKEKRNPSQMKLF